MIQRRSFLATVMAALTAPLVRLIPAREQPTMILLEWDAKTANYISLGEPLTPGTIIEIKLRTKDYKGGEMIRYRRYRSIWGKHDPMKPANPAPLPSWLKWDNEHA
jgi:hypothetical protein